MTMALDAQITQVNHYERHSFNIRWYDVKRDKPLSISVQWVDTRIGDIRIYSLAAPVPESAFGNVCYSNKILVSEIHTN